MSMMQSDIQKAIQAARIASESAKQATQKAAETAQAAKAIEAARVFAPQKYINLGFASMPSGLMPSESAKTELYNKIQQTLNVFSVPLTTTQRKFIESEALRGRTIVPQTVTIKGIQTVTEYVKTLPETITFYNVSLKEVLEKTTETIKEAEYIGGGGWITDVRNLFGGIDWSSIGSDVKMGFYALLGVVGILGVGWILSKVKG